MGTVKTEVVVLGSGPGGYAAAFYAADMGKEVVLIEQDPQLGGVCLNRGCIPSKALLHAAEVVNEAAEAKDMGIAFDKPKIDLTKLGQWKTGILKKLSGGVEGLAKKRGVKVIYGRGHFESSTRLRVETAKGQQFVEYDKCILAVGSKPALPGIFDLGNKRIMTSTEALQLAEIPKKLLIVGAGYIGMELGVVYSSLGSKVVMVEALSGVLTGADRDLARPVQKYTEKHFEELRLNTKVTKTATHKKQIKVNMSVDGKDKEELYDAVLVSVGRVPNSKDLGLENTSVKQDEKGFVQVNAQQQTDDANIFAIGDIAGGLLLAHKASKEARIAVENILGEPSTFKDVLVPAVVFTSPEVAWVGLTEEEAKSKQIEFKVAKFPWGASGRAMTMNKPDGLTKLVVDPKTDRILGVGIVGAHAGDLIGEGALAIEMGANVKDIAETLHPHPTLSETYMEAAEAFYGVATHIYAHKKNLEKVR